MPGFSREQAPLSTRFASHCHVNHGRETIKVYRIADDGRRLASGAFKAASEQDLQLKWELHLATAAGGLYIATHRGVQLGIGLASDAVRHHGGAHG